MGVKGFLMAVVFLGVVIAVPQDVSAQDACHSRRTETDPPPSEGK